MARMWWAACALVGLTATAQAVELIPAAGAIRKDRPRLLLRSAKTPLAITLDQLQAIPRDDEFGKMVRNLRASKDAAALAMVYLLTKDTAAADQAVQWMRSYTMKSTSDPFEVYMTLRSAALAYDWLYDYAGFPAEAKAAARQAMRPLAERGARAANDHVFHNYVWMSAGGSMLWALATAGEDPDSDRLFATLRDRFNNGMYPAMRYLDGQQGESPGYWTLYDLSPCVLTVLAAQSAFEEDVVGRIRKEDGDWLQRQLLTLVSATLPNLRYLTWGDIQSGPDGAVTHEVAGVADALTWALQAPEGAHFSQWVAKRRGLARFYQFHGIFYFLYTRNLGVAPAEPPLAHLAGGPTGGQFFARSDWTDSATVVAFRSTDFFGNHNHHDQGGFFIYRNGHLATDPDLYKSVGGSQQQTQVHSTLLFDTAGQRRVKAQWFKTVEEYTQNLTAGHRLETGNVLFYKDEPKWTAVAGEFGQAYPPEVVKSSVRQLLFIRPGTVVVVDRIAAPEGKTLGDVTWQLMLAAEPKIDGKALSITNGRSWLTCRSLLAQKPREEFAPSLKGTFRVALTYHGEEALTLVHLLEVGDGAPPAAPAPAAATVGPDGVSVTVAGRTALFRPAPGFDVQVR